MDIVVGLMVRIRLLLFLLLHFKCFTFKFTCSQFWNHWPSVFFLGEEKMRARQSIRMKDEKKNFFRIIHARCGAIRIEKKGTA